MFFFHKAQVKNLHIKGNTYTIRPLSLSDYHMGSMDVLSQLTIIGRVCINRFKQILLKIRRSNNHFVFAIESSAEKRVVGMGTLVIEQKFIHQGGKVGHIEDIVISKSMRGLNLGRELIDHLKESAKDQGCYKVILNCSEKNVGFYEKCGFKRTEVEMALYFPENDKSLSTEESLAMDQSTCSIFVQGTATPCQNEFMTNPEIAQESSHMISSVFQ